MGKKIEKICFCINSNDVNSKKDEQVNHTFLLNFYLIEYNNAK